MPQVWVPAANLALNLVDGGQFELAARVADEAAATYARWKTGPDSCADSDGALGNMVELTRQAVGMPEPPRFAADRHIRRPAGGRV